MREQDELKEWYESVVKQWEDQCNHLEAERDKAVLNYRIMEAQYVELKKRQALYEEAIGTTEEIDDVDNKMNGAFVTAWTVFGIIAGYGLAMFVETFF